MKKLNKKAFTIVELVIVIAVIAILAAVLIPTLYTNTTILVKENQEINKDSCADIVTNSNGLLTNKNQITKIAFLAFQSF